MNDVFLSDEIKIENLIYEIRGKQVMLDSDLAKLYFVQTKRINEAVRNNPEKFPERFSWILTDDEENNYGGRRYNTRVFTEQGVAMLATILKSKVAIQVSIRIMDTFVAMRHYISNNLLEQKYINNLVLENKEDIKEIREDVKLLQESFNKFEEKKKVNEIYFNGQIYDAYYKIKELFNEAKNELIIIDGYADNSSIKTIIDNWSSSYNNDLVSIGGYKARLINRNEIINNFAYESYYASPNNGYRASSDTPSWAYINGSKYRSMTTSEDSNNQIYGVSNTLSNENVYNKLYIRPVINLRKCALTNTCE